MDVLRSQPLGNFTRLFRSLGFGVNSHDAKGIERSVYRSVCREKDVDSSGCEPRPISSRRIADFDLPQNVGHVGHAFQRTDAVEVVPEDL